VFLAGTGAYLSLSRGKSRSVVSRFLLTRGLWLVLLELTVVRLAWEFNFNYSLAFVQVIWAIGWSMVALSALVFLPSRAVGAIGLIMIFTHNLLDGVDPGRPWRFRLALADPPCGGGYRLRTGSCVPCRLPPDPLGGRHGCRALPSASSLRCKRRRGGMRSSCWEEDLSFCSLFSGGSTCTAILFPGACRERPG
jgi:hypothetical protein